MSSLSLHELFEIERETHLKTLVNDLHSLSSAGCEKATLQRMLRAAHSLKGAARLIQHEEVERKAHALEEILKRIDAVEGLGQADLRDIIGFIEGLGGREALAGALPEIEPAKGEFTGNTLHITSKHISELIHLSSELAVITKRVDGALQQSNGHLRRNMNISESLFNDVERCNVVAATIQKMAYRMRLAPLSETTSSFPVMTQSMAGQLGKSVRLEVINGNTLIDRDLLRQLEPCLIQLLKNSVDHALEIPEEREKAGKHRHGKITLIAKQFGTVVELEFKDDGKGIDTEQVRSKVVAKGFHGQEAAAALTKEELLEFLFLPGFSTRDQVSELSGRGIGLDIVKATLTALGGNVTISTTLGAGTSFHLRIPSQIASFRALTFRCGEAIVGLPLAFIERVLEPSVAMKEVCGRLTIEYGDEIVPLIDAAKALRLKEKAPTASQPCPVIVLSASGKSVALAVDSICGEQEVVVHQLDARFMSERRILGVADGGGDQLITIVNAEQFLGGSFEQFTSVTASVNDDAPSGPEKRILIVDDSLTVRELERQLLTQAGFVCDVATDGLDGLEKVSCGQYSLIITDIDMPRLNGFELVEKLRGDEGLSKLPILVVSYKDRPEDRSRALALGADGYLSKGSFKDDSFIKAVCELIPEGEV